MDSQIIYLEKFIESTAPLPSELHRILCTIRDLDERSGDLAAQVQEDVDALLPPAGGRPPASADAAALRAQVDANQRLLVQWAEEKVQLALTGYDLLEHHLAALDGDIAALGEELAAQGYGDVAGFDAGGGGDDGLGRRGRVPHAASYDSLADPAASEAAAASAGGGRGGGAPGGGRRAGSTTFTLNLGALARAPSAAASDSYAGGAGGGGGSEAWEPRGAGGGGGGGAPARARTGPVPAPDGGAAAGAAGGGGGGYQPSRRRAAAGVQAVVAAAASMDVDGDEPPPGGAPPPARGARRAAEVAAQWAHVPPLVPGLRHAAEAPQAPGRRLGAADLTPALAGRLAELYWPADALWYLVRVQSYDPATRTAAIRYTTGETEDVALDPIVARQEMSLLDQ